jgi:hypothetical protein
MTNGWLVSHHPLDLTDTSSGAVSSALLLSSALDRQQEGHDTVGVSWPLIPNAGVVKLADARDSKSRGVHSP